MEFDKIYCGDCRHMDAIDDGSVQLVVTSPPYNVGKDYNFYEDQRPLEAYLEFLRGVWVECQRVLCRGGRLAVNVANTNRKPYIPLHAYIIRDLIDLGFMMRGEILWDKRSTAGVSTAWGSFARASNPILRDVHEYIMVFSKDSWRLEESRGTTSGIENLEFVEWTKSIWLKGTTAKRALKETARSIWRMGTQSKKIRHKANGLPHPAPFPLELPVRLILLYTNIEDVVLDPFMGSGTTALAAKLTQRHYVGYDISPDYVEMANDRIQLFTSPQPYIPELHPRVKLKGKRRRAKRSGNGKPPNGDQAST